MAERVTREALYELVWKEPMLRIAERFEVSSTYLARVCSELRVPRPPRGYWSQREFGKQPDAPPLPTAEPRQVLEWEPGASIGTIQRKASSQAKAAIEEAMGEQTPLVAAPIRGRGPQSVKTLKSHPLLLGISQSFEKVRESRYDESGILKPFKRMMPDILSSRESLGNAITLARTLYLALEGRGHKVCMPQRDNTIRRQDVDLREVPVQHQYQRSTWAPDRPTVVYIDAFPIGLTLHEMTERVEVMYVGNSTYVPVAGLTAEQRIRHERQGHWTTHQDRPSGRFRLQVYSATSRLGWVQQWSEGKTKQLSPMLPSIVGELEAKAPQLVAELAAARILDQERWEKWQEEERLRREAEVRKAQEKRRHESRQDLLAAISAWDEARRIDAYFQAVETSLRAREESSDSAAETAMLLERLTLARELAGKPDPLESLRRWKAPNER